MTRRFKNSFGRRSGTTLVELLVVILIIAILSAMLLPAFTKNVTQAHYAAEAIPLVGNIRTMVAMYQYENGKLPFDAIGAYSYAHDGTSYGAKIASYSGGSIGDAQGLSGLSPFKRMDMSVGDLSGKKLTPDQVSVICLRNEKAYAYAIGVFGKKGGLGEGTGYAILEAYFPNCVVASSTDANGNDTSEKGYKLVATWKNYTGDGCGDEPGQITFGVISGNGDSQEGRCEIFSDTFLDAKDFSAGNGVRGAVDALLSCKCGTWDIPPLPGGN